MKHFFLFLSLFLALGTQFCARAQEHRIDFSLTLSGTLLYGIDYHYIWKDHSAWRAGVTLGIEHGHFVPGAHLIYQYTFLPDKSLSPYVGVGPHFMLTTDPKRGWVHLTLLKFPVGVRYRSNPKNSFGMELWPAYFAARHKLVPFIGLSGIYSRKF